MNNNNEICARLLAAMIHRPELVATATHYLPEDLWFSPRAFSEPRLRIIADAAWTCWKAGRDTSASNIIRACIDGQQAAHNALTWLLGTYPGESEASTDRLANELAQIIRKEHLIDIMRQAIDILSGPGEPLDLIAQAQSLVAASPGSSLNIVSGDDGTREMLSDYAARRSGKAMPLGVPTGYPYIDGVMGGLPVSAVTILGARPSQGKTALASCIALHAVMAGHPCVFFSHEMMAQDILQRMACQMQKLSFAHVRAGRLSPFGEHKLAAACSDLACRDLYIIDSGGPTPQDCRCTAYYLLNKIRSRGNAMPLLIVVDYIQLEHLKGNRCSRAEELTDISSAWVETAKMTGAAILVLAQLNRQADGSQPRMAQLRESGALEQDANAVMLLWRPAKDRQPDDNFIPDPAIRAKAGANWAVLSVCKSRNSNLTEQELYWEGYCMKYRPWDDHDIHMSYAQAAAAEYNTYLHDILLNSQEQATADAQEPFL